MRKAEVKRATKETDVEVAIDLDGVGVSQIATGIGFLDHMLDLLARHSRIDMAVKAKGEDEALTRVALDISGRPFLVFRVGFGRDKVGSFDTELVQEWFQAFAMNAGVTLHVETLYGGNDHHIAESCFKGLARALRAAVAIDPRAAGEVPSTKGKLGG
jgi:imidazoleglycerol-phosphate dehydratase